jgi:hypothetical protein
MKEHAMEYAPYVEDGKTIVEYTGTYIDPSSAEMENLSLRGLFDAVFDPANMSIVVCYLDRSPHEKCNMHLFESQAPTLEVVRPPLAILTLLYRPYVRMFRIPFIHLSLGG